MKSIGRDLGIVFLWAVIGMLLVGKSHELLVGEVMQETLPASPHRELVLVYVGSSTCGWSEDADLRSGLRSAWQSVELQAENAGLAFRTIGISVDRDAEEGIHHLAAVANFDEVAAGNGWFNLAAQQYVVDQVPGPLATPQVLILERSISPKSIGARSYQVEDLRLRTRKVGAREIVSWASLGSPVPAGVRFALRRPEPDSVREQNDHDESIAPWASDSSQAD